MKLRIEQCALAQAAADAARVIPGRGGLHPVMSMIRVDATDGRVTVSAFDYETSLRIGLPADVGDEGSILLPGRALAGLAASLPAGPVELAVDGGRATLHVGRTRITLPAVAVDDYPALPKPDEPTGTVDADVLRDAVAQVAISVAAPGDPKAQLAGVRLESGDGLLTLVATDRYTLAIRGLPWGGTAGDPVTVPARGLTEAVRGFTGPVEVGIREQQVTLHADDRAVTMRTIAGDWPEWRTLAYPEPTTIVDLDRDDLAAACALSMRADERPKIPIVLTVQADGVDYRGGSRDADENQVAGQIDATVDGDGLTVAIDPAYLTAALKALGPGTVRLGLTSALRTVVLTREGVDGRHLIQPIRLP